MYEKQYEIYFSVSRISMERSNTYATRLRPLESFPVEVFIQCVGHLASLPLKVQ